MSLMKHPTIKGAVAILNFCRSPCVHTSNLSKLNQNIRYEVIVFCLERFFASQQNTNWEILTMKIPHTFLYFRQMYFDRR